MEDLLIQVLQAIFEFLFEVFIYIPFDWPKGDFRDTGGQITVIGWLFLCFSLGCGLGLVANWLHPATLVHSSTWRMLNLITAPCFSGGAAYAIARHRQQSHPHVIPGRHSLYAAAISFGVVLIRFVYATR